MLFAQCIGRTLPRTSVLDPPYIGHDPPKMNRGVRNSDEYPLPPPPQNFPRYYSAKGKGKEGTSPG